MSNGNMPANPVKGCDGTFIDDNEDNAQWLKQCNPSIGLTKREAFAMAAMQGLASFESLSLDAIASEAVGLADALLKELEKS